MTLAVRDLTATRDFYVDGLGWTPALEGGRGPDDPGGRARRALAVERGRLRGRGRPDPARPGPGAHHAGAQRRAPRDEVDDVLETARAAGADPVHAAVEREWGGYTGYFGDPDGFRWEIAWQSRTDRTGGAPMSDDKQILTAARRWRPRASGTGGSCSRRCTPATGPATSRPPCGWSTRIGAAAEEMNHHPDLDLRYGQVHVRLFSHDVFGVTSRDVTPGPPDQRARCRPGRRCRSLGGPGAGDRARQRAARGDQAVLAGGAGAAGLPAP